MKMADCRNINSVRPLRGTEIMFLIVCYFLASLGRCADANCDFTGHFRESNLYLKCQCNSSIGRLAEMSIFNTNTSQYLAMQFWNRKEEPDSNVEVVDANTGGSRGNGSIFLVVRVINTTNMNAIKLMCLVRGYSGSFISYEGFFVYFSGRVDDMKTTELLQMSSVSVATNEVMTNASRTILTTSTTVATHALMPNASRTMLTTSTAGNLLTNIVMISSTHNESLEFSVSNGAFDSPLKEILAGTFGVIFLIIAACLICFVLKGRWRSKNSENPLRSELGPSPDHRSGYDNVTWMQSADYMIVDVCSHASPNHSSESSGLYRANVRTNDVTCGLHSIQTDGGPPEYIFNAPPSYWDVVNMTPPTSWTSSTVAFEQQPDHTPQEICINMGSKTLESRECGTWDVRDVNIERTFGNGEDSSPQSETERKYTCQTGSSLYMLAYPVEAPRIVLSSEFLQSDVAGSVQETLQISSDSNNITPVQLSDDENYVNNSEPNLTNDGPYHTRASPTRTVQFSEEIKEQNGICAHRSYIVNCQSDRNTVRVEDIKTDYETHPKQLAKSVVSHQTDIIHTQPKQLANSVVSHQTNLIQSHINSLSRNGLQTNPTSPRDLGVCDTVFNNHQSYRQTQGNADLNKLHESGRCGKQSCQLYFHKISVNKTYHNTVPKTIESVV